MAGKNGRRDRSRSPVRVDSSGRRRDKHESKSNDLSHVNTMSMNLNPMMMQNMYQQAGNLMMQGGMYPNMMMQNAMMSSGMLPQAGNMEMNMSGMEMIPQSQMSQINQMQQISQMGQMEIPSIPTQSLTPSQSVDMNMMGSMMMDPSMIGMYSNINTDITIPASEKKEIVLKHCKLTPPDPGTPLPPRRVKPPGCRTIFVGGLPEKIRESTVREIFELYGRIQTLRLSKKNFCHIRYDRESSVDAAMIISGYQLRLTKEKDKDDMDEDDSADNCGWIHVDYALSRDDQNEFERRQRHALRVQQQHMDQMTAQQEMARSLSSSRRSPSPVRIQPFSSGAIVQLQEKIKSDEYFATTLPTLLAWLERGECSKRNSNQFYSMIQATNAHIRRLFNDKMQAEDELQECKEKCKTNIEKIIEQLEQVAKVFTAATHQRVWDHFTKPQRKNIETWQKMTQEFAALKEEFNEKFYGEDSDASMNYNNGNFFNQAIQGYNVQNNDELLQLKRENESLQFQLEAYKNEVGVIKADAEKEMEKFKAQFIARQALQGHILENQPPLPSPAVKPPPPPPLPDDLDTKVHLKDTVEAGCGEARLIGVISAFLQVHPQGASLDYVVSYVRTLFSHVSQATVHHVLQKHPDVFQQTTKGVGANIEKRWSFVAFQEDVKV